PRNWKKSIASTIARYADSGDRLDRRNASRRNSDENRTPKTTPTTLYASSPRRGNGAGGGKTVSAGVEERGRSPPRRGGGLGPEDEQRQRPEPPDLLRVEGRRLAGRVEDREHPRHEHEQADQREQNPLRLAEVLAPAADECLEPEPPEEQQGGVHRLRPPSRPTSPDRAPRPSASPRGSGRTAPPGS